MAFGGKRYKTSEGLQMVGVLWSSGYHYPGSFTCALSFYFAGFSLLILWIFTHGGSSGESIIQCILHMCSKWGFLSYVALLGFYVSQSNAGPFLHHYLDQKFARRYVELSPQTPPFLGKEIDVMLNTRMLSVSQPEPAMLLSIPGNHLVEWENNWPPWLLLSIPSSLKNCLCVCSAEEKCSEKREE